MKSVIFLFFITFSFIFVFPANTKSFGIQSENTGLSLNYLSYFGGSKDEHGSCIVYDSQNNIIIAGLTYSSDFPTTEGAYDRTYNGGSDVFVSKWSSDGSELLFSTFLGGTDNDSFVGSTGIPFHSLEIALDKQDNIIIYGTTSSDDFPVTAGAFNDTFNGVQDLFITKLAKDLSTLIFSTFLGGSNMDFINLGNNRLVIDNNDNIYITGVTKSADFPLSSNAIGQIKNSNNDAFFSKISSDGTTLFHSTLLNEGENDYGMGLALDSENNIIIAGTSDADVFVTKLSNDFTTKVFSTSFGGNSWEQVTGILFENNIIYILGTTGSTDFPTTSNVMNISINGGFDNFISKISSETSSLLASTFLGGSKDDYPSGFIMTDNDTINIVGYTKSTDFPITTSANDALLNGDTDYFFSSITSNLTTLKYSTFIGGSSTDDHGENWLANGHDAGEIITDNSGNYFYIIGSTRSSDLSVTDDALNKSFNGGSDLFVSIFKKSISIPSDSSTLGPSTTGYNSILTLALITISLITIHKIRKEK